MMISLPSNILALRAIEIIEKHTKDAAVSLEEYLQKNPKASDSNVLDDDGSIEGDVEFMAEFANNAIKSPYQDGHYIYIVLPGGVDYVDPDGDGTYVAVSCNECSPILYVADNEDPSKLFKKYQP